MKYMGSKHKMLKNGLGQLILHRARYAKRIVDLFCGGASVSWFVAENTKRPVLAYDLQTYAVVLAKAVIGRTRAIDASNLWNSWLSKVIEYRNRSRLWIDALELNYKIMNIVNLVKHARQLCNERSNVGPIWNSYGGYYFSPMQAITFDYLIKYLPKNDPNKAVCTAAILWAASSCAAAPGHTAQPFRPTQSAGFFIKESWDRDPLKLCRTALTSICPRHAKVCGKARTANAINVISHLSCDDLVIVDPPYSAVQYSRFYHVLETIARGKCGVVGGAGRYPSLHERPQSQFSNKSESTKALETLLNRLARVRATVIFTFPAKVCSNGLSGRMIVNKAKTWFTIDKESIKGQFSTLGGNNSHRAARQSAKELLILMRPK